MLPKHLRKLARVLTTQEREAGVQSRLIPYWAVAMGRIDALSIRESEVFALLGAGWSNRNISAELHVSERTVKKHVGQILAKLGLESRLQAGLAALAHRMSYSCLTQSGVNQKELTTDTSSRPLRGWPGPVQRRAR